MKRCKVLAALLVFGALSDAALADTVSLLPSKDNTLYEDTAGNLSNGQGVFLYTGMTGGNGLRRGLIAFDLSSIPSDATITQATLSMFLSRSGPVPKANISLSRMASDWGEGASDAGGQGGGGAQAETGDATWLHTFYNANLWITPGGDFSSTISATTPVNKVDTTYTWSGSGLLADVQSWVSNPASNLGWAIRGDEVEMGSAKQFNTGENAENPPHLTVTFTRASTLGNISTRLRVETGDSALIGGFIITGTQPKRIIVRAIGPSLTLPGALADPILELRNSSGGLIRSNDNWRNDQETEIIATTIPPSNNLESAIVETLPANNSAYSAIVRGVNNGTGIGVVEAYDLDQTVDSKLANISTRGLVQTGDNVLIGGLIVLGQNPLRVLVRAIGPSLPVPGALGNPTLELRNGSGTLVAANDNWRSDQELEIIATTIPPSNDLESAIVRDLAPGAYTAIVRGLNNSTGIAVVEAYGLN
jgi:hypothetical protein